jgi:hypothetical protein
MKKCGLRERKWTDSTDKVVKSEALLARDLNGRKVWV